MHIFYEEGGQFKTAAVVQKNDSTYQADTAHGKRVKIKAANVFLELDGDAAAFLAQARAEADTVDIPLLWEVSGTEEFTAAAAAAEYYGEQPSKAQTAAVLMALYDAPLYFHKKAKGVFKAAPADILQQALAAAERKRQIEAQIEQWRSELLAGQLPAAVAAEIRAILHQPDKQSPAYKAFAAAADSQKISLYELAKRTGAVSGLPEYLQQRFEYRYFPQGIGFGDVSAPQLPLLPEADSTVRAFSVDDASTTEIDDALSVRHLDNGITRVGIHIAAPALAVAADSEIEKIIMQRLSTVYFPAGKITMLPESWISAFSLDEGALRPAFSAYFDFDGDFNLLNVSHRIERVWIEHNLRIHAIEPYFNSETGIGSADAPQFPFHAEMIWLHGLAQGLQKQRDRYEENPVKKYDYGIELDETGRVSVSKRERGSPIDTVVSEMMILANSTWAQMLDEHQLGGLFRVQPSGRVRMATQADTHIGMNLSHYGWFTSPLRRAADYINQKQLQSLLNPDCEPRFSANDAMLFAAVSNFDNTYNAYRDFQNSMEAYWSLVYLQQENISEINAQVLKEDLVRLEGVPLVARAAGIPAEIPPKSTVKLAVTEVDSEQQFVGLRYLAPVAPPPAQ
ncbi:ribonuclease catalytic domain-containing protein [Conchiformibius steedae]|uniref:RNB domain-containing ribonuclease n=1 Tax=Conchiformibius steedae TaxID=153493 RepID=A0A3P2A3R2_9NEIS|nr:RNB domain-containing ribonuclease [Conchiformibius steedae]RRD89536.1 RNB domain-containing ribonuclease [Conchiformibius steedae]